MEGRIFCLNLREEVIKVFVIVNGAPILLPFGAEGFAFITPDVPFCFAANLGHDNKTVAWLNLESTTQLLSYYGPNYKTTTHSLTPSLIWMKTLDECAHKTSFQFLPPFHWTLSEIIFILHLLSKE